MKTLRAGDLIPHFKLTDQYGKTFNLHAYRGKKLVIYFYPKDESPICKKEACAFRDSFVAFEALGATVVGISSGSVESHRAFAFKHRLPFLLLSDPDNKVLRLFGVKPMLFLNGRETFVVDEWGRVAFTFRNFLDAIAHPIQVLEFFNSRRA